MSKPTPHNLDEESPGQLDASALFVELLGENERSLFGYIFSLTSNWDDSQEIMQRLRIRLWEQFSQYDRTRPFDAWARAIAYYLVLAFRKERSRKREYFSESVMELLHATYIEEWEEVNSSRAILSTCLDKLPRRQQEFVKSYYSQGGAAALAESLGKTANAIRQTVFRIRKVLLECVERKQKASLQA